MMKHGRITPLLKAGLDKTVMANYGPSAKPSTLWKMLERLVLCHLQPYMLSSGNFSVFQLELATRLKGALLQIHNNGTTSFGTKKIKR